MKRYLFLLGALSCFSTFTNAQSLIINEVMVGNVDMNIDPSYNYGGWVELYNPSDKSFSLSKIYVSDDPNNLQKYQMPALAGSVGAGRFRTLWFDHYSTGNEYSDNSTKQVSFKLNPDGGTLYFSTSEGELFLEQSYPAGIPRISYARTIDGGPEWRYSSTPTLAASNAKCTFADERLEAPHISHNSTVFRNSFMVTVDIPEGATLRFTTDGTTPTLKNGSTSASGTFKVAGASRIYRFCLFKDGYLPSPVLTRSYIYNDKDYYLPIVSIVTDEANLYDNTIGAYTDGTNGIDGNNRRNSNKNRDWERPVNFEYILPDNTGEYCVMAINQEVDFEVNGGWSRHFAPAASFKLKTDKRYDGVNYLGFPIFTSKPYTKNKAIVVRNGGNDNNSRIMDAAIHEILRSSGFYIDCQAWQPSHVFINGQYKFMFNVRETNNKFFAYGNYGIDKDEVDQFEINSVQGYAQKAGDDEVFMQWLNLATKLAQDPQNDDLYRQICDIVDIDEYCNYMAAECYVGCNDWLTNSNNVKGFRDRNDGKFHLVFMDLDQGFTMNDMINALQRSRNDSRYSTGRNFLIDIFLNMLRNETFQRRFIDAYCIVAGSIFTPERVTSIITRMAETTEAALSLDGQSPWNSANSLMRTINSENNRNTRMNALRNYLGLRGGYNVSISANIPEAEISLGGQKIPTAHLEGTVFGNPLFTTSAPSSYRFAGWKMDGGAVNRTTIVPFNAQWTYYDQGSMDGRSWMIQQFVTTTWNTGAAPLGYNNQNSVTTTIDYGGDSQHKRTAYYFRHQFNLDKAPTADQDIQLTFYVDDGCIIYLNGKEIHRYNMPDGDISYADYSITYVGTDAYSETITIDPSLLRKGANVIAVEVHNNNDTSSDLYWAAELSIAEEVESLVSDQLDLSSLDPSGTYRIMACYEPLSDDDILAQHALQPFAPVRVNEVSAVNSIYANEYFQKNDWIELYNATSVPLDVAGLYISDNPSKPQKYQIPSGVEGVNTIIPAHGHLIVWADKLDPLAPLVDVQWERQNITELHVPFKLDNDDHQEVIISSSPEFVANNATYFQDHPALQEFTDRFFYNTHKGNQTVGRYPDGGNNIYVMNRPTICMSNAPHTYDEFLGVDCDQTYADIELAINPIEQELPGATGATEVRGVYTTGGLLVGRDPQALRPGIYIIRYSDGHTRKVVIK